MTRGGAAKRPGCHRAIRNQTLAKARVGLDDPAAVAFPTATQAPKPAPDTTRATTKVALPGVTKTDVMLAAIAATSPMLPTQRRLGLAADRLLASEARARAAISAV